MCRPRWARARGEAGGVRTGAPDRESSVVDSSARERIRGVDCPVNGMRPSPRLHDPRASNASATRSPAHHSTSSVSFFSPPSPCHPSIPSSPPPQPLLRRPHPRRTLLPIFPLIHLPHLPLIPHRPFRKLPVLAFRPRNEAREPR
jgi:hypothetical protein